MLVATLGAITGRTIVKIVEKACQSKYDFVDDCADSYQAGWDAAKADSTSVAYESTVETVASAAVYAANRTARYVAGVMRDVINNNTEMIGAVAEMLVREASATSPEDFDDLFEDDDYYDGPDDYADAYDLDEEYEDCSDLREFVGDLENDDSKDHCDNGECHCDGGCSGQCHCKAKDSNSAEKSE